MSEDSFPQYGPVMHEAQIKCSISAYRTLKIFPAFQALPKCKLAF